MKRIMVIGGSGSGKSTVARKIGDITGLPVIHIDPMYWKAGWVLREPSETQRLVIAAAQGETWVFDGNNSQTFEARADRADAIVFLDLPTWLRFCRVVWRSMEFFGRSRPDMAAGCPERLDYDFVKFVLSYRKRGARDQAVKLLESYAPRTRTYHLRSRREVAQFLDELQVSLTAGEPSLSRRDQDDATQK